MKILGFWFVFLLIPLLLFDVAFAQAKAGEANLASPITVLAKSSEKSLTIQIPKITGIDVAFNGGAIDLLPDRISYIGIDLASEKLISLPRLGHRGWIPIGRVVTGPTGVTDYEPLPLASSNSRLVKSLKKNAAGRTVNVLIMGSSLLQATPSSSNWPNILFSQGALSKVSGGGKFSPRYAAVPGAGNSLQLAQLLKVSGKQEKPDILSGVDFVIIGTLANSGEEWEAIALNIFKILAKSGVEVLVVTDNAQKGNDGLYSKGKDLMGLADRFGFEIADTAAYVAEADMRKPGTIYRDHIHMTSSSASKPASGNSVSGQQVWAMAIQSVLNKRSDKTDFEEMGRAKSSLPSTSHFKLLTAENLLSHPIGKSQGGVLVSNPLAKNSLFGPLGINSGKMVLAMEKGDEVSLSIECTKSLYVIFYGDQSTPPAHIAVRSADVQVTDLPGAFPFANQWVRPIYKSVVPVSSPLSLIVRDGKLMLESILVEEQDCSHSPS